MPTYAGSGRSDGAALAGRAGRARRSAGLVSARSLAAVIAKSGHSPSGAVGWPLLWTVPLLPFRLANRIGPDVSFGVGVTVSVVANAATVIAIGYAGRDATRSARVGGLAA